MRAQFTRECRNMDFMVFMRRVRVSAKKVCEKSAVRAVHKVITQSRAVPRSGLSCAISEIDVERVALHVSYATISDAFAKKSSDA